MMLKTVSVDLQSYCKRCSIVITAYLRTNFLVRTTDFTNHLTDVLSINFSGLVAAVTVSRNLFMAAESRPYRLSHTSRMVLGGLTDLLTRRRSPSLSRKRNKPYDQRKCSAPAGLHQAITPVMDIVVASAQSHGCGSLVAGKSADGRNSPVQLHTDMTMQCFVSPIVNVLYTGEEAGRNLLNKKDTGPPSTIKESSESSQTLDDNESDKGNDQ
uniref:Pecanex-like protein n=1 Tax=Heterorhabditis bacteriophora TaxID=37862 RepID=A0A1I7XVA4_HETBA